MKHLYTDFDRVCACVRVCVRVCVQAYPCRHRAHLGLQLRGGQCGGQGATLLLWINRVQGEAAVISVPPHISLSVCNSTHSSLFLCTSTHPHPSLSLSVPLCPPPLWAQREGGEQDFSHVWKTSHHPVTKLLSSRSCDISKCITFFFYFFFYTSLLYFLQSKREGGTSM